mgnify:CR=1 FL=1
MNSAMEYLIFCADRGDFQHFLKRSKGKECVYRGDNGFDIHLMDGKIVKVTHLGKDLQLVGVEG